MADTALQPRTRHLVAVFALLISSVGGFAPQTPRRIHHPNDAVAPASTGSAASTLVRCSRPAPLHRGRRRQRGEWGDAGEQRWPEVWCGQGLAVGEAAEQQRTGNGNNNKFFVGSEVGGSSFARGLGLQRKPRRSTSVMMALHFPKPPKVPQPPPLPPPSGDKTPARGKSAGRDASSSSTPAGSAGSRTLKGDASSPKANAKGAAGAGAEGVVDVSGLITKTRNVSVGHANATRSDLNRGKVSRESNRQTTQRGSTNVLSRHHVHRSSVNSTLVVLTIRPLAV